MQLGGLGQTILIKNNEFFVDGRSCEVLDLERVQFLFLGQGEGEGQGEQEERANHFSGRANATWASSTAQWSGDFSFFRANAAREVTGNAKANLFILNCFFRLLSSEPAGGRCDEPFQ